MSNEELDTAEFYFPSKSMDPATPEPSLASRARMECAGVSHVGNARENNEDAFLIYRTGRFWEKVATNIEDPLLRQRVEEYAYTMVVADGMGGLAAGEVASRTAITTAVNLVLSSVKWTLKLDQPETRQQEIQEAVERAIGYFSSADLAVSQKSGQSRMGSTLTAAYVVGDDLFIMHVGDSRVYLFREAQLTQLTRDHTVAQALADSGIIPESAVQHHRLKHILTKAVGLHEGKVDVELHQLKLQDGDVLMLCSDGLSDCLSAPVIAGVLGSDLTPEGKCEQLLKEALQSSGKDNITVLVGHYSIQR